MGYNLEWNPSPNFTPGNQTQAFYGRPRTIEFGAGHWWNTPEAGAQHDGVVGTFKNAARQASAHAVLSANRVTEMVRSWDTAWCTNNANPYTYAIEVDPRIMWKWGWGGANASMVAQGNAIFETLAEYIADKGYHALEWRPHNFWWSTQCNPIRWNEVMIRARQIRAAKDAPQAPPVKEVGREVFSPTRKMIFTRDITLQKIPTGDQADTKVFGANTEIDIAQLLTMSNGAKWYRTAYSAANELATGFPESALKLPVAPPPEWVTNKKDINDVKLMVMVASAIVHDLNTGKPVGNPIPQGTWVDISMTTTVKGVEYLISKYSADHAMPNGILKTDLGIPAPVPDPNPTPPKPVPEPDWLTKWEDIADITMFTRQPNVEVVDLLDGKTVSVIAEKGTGVAIASATEWHGQKYLITEYSTAKKLPRGIRLVDLDIKPVENSTDPLPADPDKSVDDVIRENNTLLKAILALLTKLWDNVSTK